MNRAVVWACGALGLFGCVVAGCAGMEPASRREAETRVYDHDRQVVYMAVVAQLQSKRFPIRRSDPLQGLVETGWLVEKYKRVRAVARVERLAKKRTLLKLGLFLEEKGVFGGAWKPKPVKLATYDRFFEDIDLQIYREYFHRIERKSR